MHPKAMSETDKYRRRGRPDVGGTKTGGESKLGGTKKECLKTAFETEDDVGTSVLSCQWHQHLMVWVLTPSFFPLEFEGEESAHNPLDMPSSMP